MSDNETDDATEDVPIDEIHAVDPASHGSSTWKVLGEIDAQDGTGVLGHNTATTGAATGVAGVTDSSANDAAGVMGTATATTGQSSGVEGVTNAAESQATGVHGSAPGGAVTYGVRGDSSAQNGRGVIGFATSQGYSHSIPAQFGAGVMGVTDRSSSDSLLSEGIGVLGWTTAGGGDTRGVVGRNENSSQGIGVMGYDATGSGWGIASFSDAWTGGVHEFNQGVIHRQRGDPTTSDLENGRVMVYNSDGSGTGAAGDLVYAINDGGTIKTTVIVAKSDATA